MEKLWKNRRKKRKSEGENKYWSIGKKKKKMKEEKM